MINESNYGLTEEDIVYLMEDPKINYDLHPNYLPGHFNALTNPIIIGTKGSSRVHIALQTKEQLVGIYIKSGRKPIAQIKSVNENLFQLCENIMEKLKENERSEMFNTLMDPPE